MAGYEYAKIYLPNELDEERGSRADVASGYRSSPVNYTYYVLKVYHVIISKEILICNDLNNRIMKCETITVGVVDFVPKLEH